MKQKGKLIILSGPAGAGKGTLRSILFDKVEGLIFSVSCTTRKPRPKEIEGKDYFFVEKQEFQAMVESGAFLEWATVHGECYGTPRKEVLDVLEHGRSVILEIDVQGALQVKENFPDAVTIFIYPPNKEILEKRLKQRGTDSASSITLRLKNAENEMQTSSAYDYVVVNDEVERASRELIRIVRELTTNTILE